MSLLETRERFAYQWTRFAYSRPELSATPEAYHSLGAWRFRGEEGIGYRVWLRPLCAVSGEVECTSGWHRF
jgi:hypothetical protein